MNKPNNPLVSILVPVYGVEKYIENCAVSLMEQTYENIEYIFVNDCTKDSSIEILETVLNRYPQRKKNVKIIIHENNRGLAAARNTAVVACNGDYLWHVDSDDWIPIDAVEKLIAEIKKSEKDIIIFSNYNVQIDKITKTNINYKDKVSYISSILLHTTAGSVWNKFFRTEFYRNTGILSIEGLNHGEDYAIIPRLLHKAKKIQAFDEPLYYYNQTNQNSYTCNIRKQSIVNINQAYKINFEYFSTVYDKELYEDCLNLLPFRSMLALIKRADITSFSEICKIYPECFEHTCKYLSKLDKSMLTLLKHQKYTLLFNLIKIYKHLNR